MDRSIDLHADEIEHPLPSLDCATFARMMKDLVPACQAEIEYDDLAWAQPLVDEALAEVERGEVMSRAAYRARLRAAGHFGWKALGRP